MAGSFYGPGRGSENQAGDEPFLLSARDAAKRLAISPRTLFTLTSTGEIPCVRIGKLVRYSVETLKKWIRDHESTDHSPMPRQAPPDAPASKPTLVESDRPAPKRKPPKKRAISMPSSPVQAEPKRVVRERSPEDVPEQRNDPFYRLVKGLGIDRDSLPPMTNGELVRVAGVDSIEYRQWKYRGGTLPEEALARLREYVQRMNQRSRDGTSSSL